MIDAAKNDTVSLETPDGTLTASVNNAEAYPAILVENEGQLVAAVSYDGVVKDRNGQIMTEAYADGCGEVLYKISFKDGENHV